MEVLTSPVRADVDKGSRQILQSSVSARFVNGIGISDEAKRAFEERFNACKDAIKNSGRAATVPVLVQMQNAQEKVAAATKYTLGAPICYYGKLARGGISKMNSLMWEALKEHPAGVETGTTILNVLRT